jgi:hypothetical protein
MTRKIKTTGNCGDCGIGLTEENRTTNKEQSHKFCQECWAKRDAAACKKHQEKLRNETFQAYGGKCAECGETEFIFLTIDHINDDGAEHRRQINRRTGRKFYCWLKQNNWPKGNFQLLCRNCNFNKFILNKCYKHLDKEFIVNNTNQKRKSCKDGLCLYCMIELTDENWPKSKQFGRHKYSICHSCLLKKDAAEKIALRLEVIAAYGGKCVCCKETNEIVLTIDHIDETGAYHRMTLKQAGIHSVYRWLRRNKFPKDNFQLLCQNCNFAKRYHKNCPHNLS